MSSRQSGRNAFALVRSSTHLARQPLSLPPARGRSASLTGRRSGGWLRSGLRGTGTRLRGLPGRDVRTGTRRFERQDGSRCPWRQPYYARCYASGRGASGPEGLKSLTLVGWIDNRMSLGAPKGNRTPVFAVKGRRPGPLDDGRNRWGRDVRRRFPPPKPSYSKGPVGDKRDALSARGRGPDAPHRRPAVRFPCGSPNG